MYERTADLPDLQPNAPRRSVQDPLPVIVQNRPFSGVPENNRGQSTIVSPGAVNANVLDLKHGGEDGEMLTISLGFEIVNNTTTTPLPLGRLNDFFVQALIQWGVGGSTLTALVDVQRGCFLRVPASTVRVSINYTNAATFPNDIRVTALVGYGNQSTRTSNARFTQRFPAIAAPAGSLSIVQDIPDFASAFTVGLNVGAAVAGPFPIVVTLSSATQNLSYFVADATVPIPENTYVIPQGFTTLRITNNSTVAITPTVTYALTL